MSGARAIALGVLLLTVGAVSRAGPTIPEPDPEAAADSLAVRMSAIARRWGKLGKVRVPPSGRSMDEVLAKPSPEEHDRTKALILRLMLETPYDQWNAVLSQPSTLASLSESTL